VEKWNVDRKPNPTIIDLNFKGLTILKEKFQPIPVGMRFFAKKSHNCPIYVG
jgi:hypothetical protein